MFLKCYILGKHLSWQADTLASATRVDCITEKRYVVFTPDQLDKGKGESFIGLDKNLQLSFFAGLFGSLGGAAFNFWNQKTDADLVSSTIICHATSREKKLKLLSLFLLRVSAETSMDSNAAEFEWSPPAPQENSDFWVRVDCYKKGQVSSAKSLHEFQYGAIRCRLENLEAETTYVLKVYDMKGKDLNCWPVEFTTRPADRFANNLVEQIRAQNEQAVRGMDFNCLYVLCLNFNIRFIPRRKWHEDWRRPEWNGILFRPLDQLERATQDGQ